MEILSIQYIILGALQGITELLPISSSAHLALLPWFFTWQDPGLSSTIALHMGTLLAILLYFRQDWFSMARAFITGLQNRDFLQRDSRIFLCIIFATIPGALIGFFLQDYAETLFRSPLLIAGALIVFSGVIFFAEKFGKRVVSMHDVSLWPVFFIGLLQACAIIPGVSRSGATIAGGLYFGLKRPDAARFSFLLSAPIIFGAGLVTLPGILERGIAPSFVAGLLATFVVGYATISFLMRFIQNHSFYPFVWYRLALAMLIIAVWLVR